MSALTPPVELDYRATSTDKRLNARAESLMRVIEDMTKAIMAGTRLGIEDWDIAVDHSVWLLNLLPMSRKINKDGSGPRPLQELSRWYVSVKECDRRLAASQLPGTLCYVRMADQARGSNLSQLGSLSWSDRGLRCRLTPHRQILMGSRV